MAQFLNLPAVSEREQATILASLRYYQKSYNVLEQAIDGIATNGGKFVALAKTEIDNLCERINMESVADEAQLR
jgi:hypothetical protein